MTPQCCNGEICHSVARIQRWLVLAEAARAYSIPGRGLGSKGRRAFALRARFAASEGGFCLW